MYYIMHRTQILLDRWQYEQLKAAAEREGRSLSSLVRDAVTLFLEGSHRKTATKLAEIGGLGADGAARGRDHDTVVYGRRRKSR
jgi:hypothetical protein